MRDDTGPVEARRHERRKATAEAAVGALAAQGAAHRPGPSAAVPDGLQLIEGAPPGAIRPRKTVGPNDGLNAKAGVRARRAFPAMASWTSDRGGVLRPAPGLVPATAARMALLIRLTARLRGAVVAERVVSPVAAVAQRARVAAVPPGYSWRARVRY